MDKLYATQYKEIYKAKTKNKNNMKNVRNIIQNQDLILSKLTHDILYLYNLYSSMI
jgi:hypothetical protein